MTSPGRPPTSSGQRKPRIGLSAHLLSLAEDYRGAGINRYISALLTHLPQAGPQFETLAFVGEARLRDAPPPGLRLAYPLWPTANRRAARIAWEQLAQPVALWREGIDLVHGLAYALPLLRTARGVVTVHDLSFLLYPAAFNRVNRLYLAAITRQSVRRAQAVIADSANTRADLIRLLGVPTDKVVAIPLGVDPQYAPPLPQQVAAFRQRQGLPDRFILYLGTLEPRKNLPMLVRAYAELRRADPAAPKLLLAGGAGWRYAPLLGLVEELGLKDSILFPGYVPQADLPLWYAAAEVLAYPSLYEGFGLPPLEAMACGTPVVVSTASSLPEVVGDAGLLVPSHDSAALAHALNRLLTEADLRAEMRARGLDRAAQFTWLRTAQMTADVYERVLTGQPLPPITSTPRSCHLPQVSEPAGGYSDNHHIPGAEVPGGRV
ncbi:MAG: glycosyltransferase family 4 protein [Anaerolineae bacterium]|nr:glycosyltransferase family 4 protein [Anaerolineae bacterium]